MRVGLFATLASRAARSWDVAAVTNATISTRASFTMQMTTARGNECVRGSPLM